MRGTPLIGVSAKYVEVVERFDGSRPHPAFPPARPANICRCSRISDRVVLRHAAGANTDRSSPRRPARLPWSARAADSTWGLPGSRAGWLVAPKRVASSSIYTADMPRRTMQEATFLILTALAAGSQHGYGIISDVAKISEGLA